MITHEQKNTNILNRFESKVIGTKTKKYKINVRGDVFSMICMNGETLQDAKESCISKWGDLFEAISES